MLVPIRSTAIPERKRPVRILQISHKRLMSHMADRQTDRIIEVRKDK